MYTDYITTSSFWNPWPAENIQAISETQGSRKGHGQIWECPIASQDPAGGIQNDPEINAHLK